MDLFNIALPKWPAMHVAGKPVTVDQATEILFRTFNGSIDTNDHDFINYISERMNVPQEDNYSNSLYLTHQQQKEYGMLPLYYLENNRIASCWIGGPKGWCDWNGTIFTSHYNIGKYPSVEYVYNDWEKIAGAFPFLNLSCKLFSGETGEVWDGTAKAVIQFDVKDGEVTMRLPDPNFACEIIDEDEKIEWFAKSLGRDRDNFEHMSYELFNERFESFKKIRGMVPRIEQL